MTIPEVERTIVSFFASQDWTSCLLFGQARSPLDVFLSIRCELISLIGSYIPAAGPRKEYVIWFVVDVRNSNSLARCSGSAVKIRHCPATVSGRFFDCTSHCPSRVGRRSRSEVGRESGDRSRQAHSPLFLGRRRTLMSDSDRCHRFCSTFCAATLLADVVCLLLQSVNPMAVCMEK